MISQHPRSTGAGRHAGRSAVLPWPRREGSGRGRNLEHPCQELPKRVIVDERRGKGGRCGKSVKQVACQRGQGRRRGFAFPSVSADARNEDADAGAKNPIRRNLPFAVADHREGLLERRAARSAPPPRADGSVPGSDRSPRPSTPHSRRGSTRSSRCAGEQPEAGKQHREPEDQHREEGRRQRGLCLLDDQPARLGQPMQVARACDRRMRCASSAGASRMIKW